MIPARSIDGFRLRCVVRRLAREVLVCVALPAALMVSVEVLAQKTTQTQAQAQSQAQTSAQSQTQAQRSDEQIAIDISSRLKSSSVLHPLNLGVWVHDGTITLSGAVPNPDVRQQAVAFMKAVPGVRSVDDQLTIGSVAASEPPPVNGAGNDAEAQADEASGNLAPVPPDEPNPPGEPGQPYQPAVPGQPPPPPNVPGQPYRPSPGLATRNGAPQMGGSPYAQPMVTIPAGTPVHVMMLDGIDSKHTQPGARFRAVAVEDVILLNGAMAIPRGAYVDGVVIDSRPPGKLKGHPKLALRLTNAQIGNDRYALSSYVWARRGPGKGGETTGNVVGGAAVGTIAGGFAGGGAGALLGMMIGGLGGAGLSALSGGAHLVVPAESVITFYLNAPFTLREPSLNEIRSLAGNVPIGPGPGQGSGPYQPGYGPPPPPPGPPGGYPY